MKGSVFLYVLNPRISCAMRCAFEEGKDRVMQEAMDDMEREGADVDDEGFGSCAEARR